MTKIINLIGGPGTGKSTIAAELFAKMKWQGISVELVTEYAKDLVWEQRKHTFKNELYIFAKQHHRLFRLQGEVDYIITDSPIIQSIFYNKIYGDNSEIYENFVLNEFNKFENINFWLKRTKPYVEKGRNQTQEEADAIGYALRAMLLRLKIQHEALGATQGITSQYILEKFIK